MKINRAIIVGVSVLLSTLLPSGISSAATINKSSTAAKTYAPVTFTQQGWSNQGRNLVYSSWRYAFYNFSFYGFVRQNWLYAGGIRTMSVEGSTSGLRNLLAFLPQTGPSCSLKFTQNFQIPAPIKNAGALAGEVVALTMNVAFNDVRAMPRHPGYDLEKFTITSGQFRGYTVGRMLDIGNRILGGESVIRYGFNDYESVTAVLRSINSNYEFINIKTFIDRGFLQPNRALGPAGPPHYPRVP